MSWGLGNAATDGRIIWDVDTVREYNTVNGVKNGGGIPGNVLLAFSIDGK